MRRRDDSRPITLAHDPEVVELYEPDHLIQCQGVPIKAPSIRGKGPQSRLIT